MSRARFKLKQFSKPLVSSPAPYADEEAHQEAQRKKFPVVETGNRRLSLRIDDGSAYSACSVYVWGQFLDEIGFRKIPGFEDHVITQIAAGGGLHVAALTAQGKILVCGKGRDGQLGLGPDILSAEQPTFVKALDEFFITQVAVGGAQTAAITSDGKLYVWGTSRERYWFPHLVDEFGSLRVSQVVMSLEHIAVLAHPEEKSGPAHVFTWGRGDKGQLGHGDCGYKAKPTELVALRKHDIVHLSTGETHMTALTRGERLYIWGTIKSYHEGKDLLGVSGQGSTITHPVRLPGLHNVAMPACGSRFTAALTKSGALYTWGDGKQGFLGHGSSVEVSCKPRKIKLGPKVKIDQVACGTYHTCVLTEGNMIFSWGHGRFGKLGTADEDNRFQPLRVPHLRGRKVTQICCGSSFTLALTEPKPEALPVSPTEVPRITLDAALRAGTSKQGDGGLSLHCFEPTTYFGPTWCCVCEQFIWGLRKQGFTCTRCQMDVHPGCRPSVASCTGKPVPKPNEKTMKSPKIDRKRNKKLKKSRALLMQSQSPTFASRLTAKFSSPKESLNSTDTRKHKKSSKKKTHKGRQFTSLDKLVPAARRSLEDLARLKRNDHIQQPPHRNKGDSSEDVLPIITSAPSDMAKSDGSAQDKSSADVTTGESPAGSTSSSEEMEEVPQEAARIDSSRLSTNIADGSEDSHEQGSRQDEDLGEEGPAGADDAVPSRKGEQVRFQDNAPISPRLQIEAVPRHAAPARKESKANELSAYSVEISPKTAKQLNGRSVSELLAEISSLQKQLHAPWYIDASEVHLEKRLGSGAYGEVWKASYRGQDVAVKILHKALTEKLPKDFDRELSILREFKSPYTVVFLGICKKPHPCLVMECCARGSLHDLLGKPHGSVPCDWSYTISYALQIAKGLKAMHGWKPPIIHRDLKTMNILVTQTYQLKICDFGTARFKRESKTRPGMEEDQAALADAKNAIAAQNSPNHRSRCRRKKPTRVNTFTQIRGTYSHMSPELRFKQAATTKSDIFAFGIIFWEIVFRCISGYYQEPYSEYPSLFACKEAIHKAVAEENIRPTIPSTCPNAVAELIRRCWAADPADRPSSESLVKMLEQVQREYTLNEDEWDDAYQFSEGSWGSDYDSESDYASSSDEEASGSS